MKTRSWISSVCFSRCTVCIVYVVSDVIQYDMNWLAHISCENTAQCAVLIWRWFPYSPKFYTCILNYSVHCVSGLRDMSVNGSFLRYSCSAAGVCVEVDDHVMWCVCFSFSVKLWERLGADERFVQLQHLFLFSQRFSCTCITWGVSETLSVILVWMCELLWSVSGTLRLIKEADGWAIASSSSAFPLINVRHLELRCFSEASWAAAGAFNAHLKRVV